MNYTQAVEFLYSLQFFGIKLGLDNTKDFLKRVDCINPKPKIVHIAGTNGKGSTAAVIAKITEEHGYNVGLYTSPHILDFRERIRINGEVVSKEYVISFVLEHKDYILQKKLTFFEVTTVMAIAFFSLNSVDFIVLETGMGGRLDATNCFSPEIAVITNVSMDHQSFLGDTLEKIVDEKAGIIKPNIPLVCASQNDVVTAQIKKKCGQIDSDFVHIALKDVTEDHFQFNSKSYSNSLLGKHQQLNGKTALTVCSKLYSLEKNNVDRAFQNVRWRARLEVWEKYKNVYLDVSHNADGVKETVSALKKMAPNTKYIIVFAFLDDKDSVSNLSILNEIAVKFYSYPFENKRLKSDQSFPAKYDVRKFNYESFKHFLNHYSDKKILVIGSHYLIEDILNRASE